jgi:hypothetical protein
MAETKIEWAHQANWGRRIVRKDGYVLVHCPAYPGPKSNKGHVLEHRLVMAASLGRALRADEHIHHLNGNKQDNRLANLELTTNSDHRKLHNAELPRAVLWQRAAHLVEAAKKRAKARIQVNCACGCSRSLTTPDSKGRQRLYIQGHNQSGKTWMWNSGRNKN